VLEEEEEEKGNTAEGRIRPATTAADKDACAERGLPMRVTRMDAGEADTRHAVMRALHAEAEQQRTVRCPYLGS